MANNEPNKIRHLQLTVNSGLVEPVEKFLIPVFASFPIGVEGPQTVTVHSGGLVLTHAINTARVAIRLVDVVNSARVAIRWVSVVNSARVPIR